MRWALSASVDLHNERIRDDDAGRQTRTAAEILRRLDEQPGVILADEVGTGKTYVALAVAVSVLEATRRKHPVVVMVPSAVAEKWPVEWAVFAERCLPPGHGLRASEPVRRGSDFLKFFDDPASRRRHLVFVTHGALTSNLNDPFIRLALIRRATQRRREFLDLRRPIARSAAKLLNDRRFRDPDLVESLLAAPEAGWRELWALHSDQALDDDPVPFTLLDALGEVDLDPLRQAILEVPKRQGASYEARVKRARHQLNQALNETWTASLNALDVRLPLLILDEAHHVRHPNQLARLFANDEAERDAEALQQQGPLGNKFAKMLFLTATPFQLGHHELLHVLDRFHGVRWPSTSARRQFDSDLEGLRAALDRAQAGALRLERAWARIDPLDTPTTTDISSFEPDDAYPEAVGTALAIGRDARVDLDRAEELMRPWVIRHARGNRSDRRRHLPGRSILDGDPGIGLAVSAGATLPFLLATRAQAVASLHGASGAAATNTYFAYGLASSFEAYRDTRANRIAALDDTPDASGPPHEIDPQLRWYLDRIADALPRDDVDGCAAHPKMAATVERIRQLWCAGEKGLVFCFYVETGRALRAHISRALHREIATRAANGLGLDPHDEPAVDAALNRLGERLLRSDTRSYNAFRNYVLGLAAGLDDASRSQLADVVIRFMRTPSFLVRFVDLSPTVSPDDLFAGLERPDLSGTTLTQRITSFAESLHRKVDMERDEIIAALTGIQTGGIATAADLDEPDRPSEREILLPNVRLANGAVDRATRRRLMLGFNTPFFPEVLVASAVMAEGVDLHQDCRHVIHHDLDWNPSTLEQRTGRLDRIGSKAEAVQRPIMIYEPYVGGTHDEKMFRVVKDRDQWFGIVMGEAPDSGELATERRAARVPLPLALAQQLTMDLSLRRDDVDGESAVGR